MRAIRASHRALAAGALVAAFTVSAAFADRWDDALALVPGNAQTVVVIPSPKQASDDLQQGMERMGRQEVAAAGRPIDLARAQLGIGAGFDDKGALVAWTMGVQVPQQWCALIPVTDAETFIHSSLKPVEPSSEHQYTMGEGGEKVFARAMGKHVLLGSDAAQVKGYEAGKGIGADLMARLGTRGSTVARSGDVMVWLHHDALSTYADQFVAQQDQSEELGGGDPTGGMLQMVQRRTKEMAESSAAVVKQLSDAVFTADFDAMGLGLRAYLKFDPASPLASSAQPSNPEMVTSVSSLLNSVPGAPFYFTGGVDLKAMGGLARLRAVLASLPMGQHVPLPAWLDAVQGKIDGLQVAFYPSKLAILTGGLANDAALFIRTSDPAAIKGALRDWVKSQAGERDGIKSESSWEDVRELKDGTKAAAYSVKETVMDLDAAGGPMQRMVKQVTVGSRGLHGFAVDVPQGVVVTFSQRTDVLERAMKAASAAGVGEAPAGSMGGQGVIKSFGPWLMPSPDLVAFIGVTELMAAAQAVMAAMPGAGGADEVPPPPGPSEPIALGFRSKDGAWEAALVVPSSSLALAYQSKLQARTRARAEPQGK